MRKLALTGIILQPSVASFVVVVTTSSLALLSSLFNIGGTNDSVYRLLLGPDSSIELVDSTKSIVDSVSQIIFDNPVVNRLLFFTFWLFVGLLVYMLLSGAGLGIGAAQKLHDDENLLNAHKDALRQDIVLRLALRAAALFGWVIYMTLFFKLFLPFSMLAYQVALGGSFSLIGVATGLLGFSVLIISLHLHIVLLRCLLLRPRIIGGWDDVIAAHLT